MELAKKYLDRYNQASSADERTAIVREYSALFDTLPETARTEARAFMQHHLKPSIDETVKTLDALTEKAELILAQMAHY